METTKKVAIYIGVATPEQGTKNQERACRKYCDDNGLTVIGVFKDVHSGTTWEDLPDFLSMRESYLAGEINGIVVVTPARITRDEKQLRQLLEEMCNVGVEVYCIDEDNEDIPHGYRVDDIGRIVADISEPRKVAVYTCVTTPGEGATMQEATCRKYCNANGLTIVGISQEVHPGRIWNSSDFASLYDSLTSMQEKFPEIAGIVMTIPLHLAGNENCPHLLEEMRNNGIELYCIVEGIPYGYHVDETGRLVINKAEALMVRALYTRVKHINKRGISPSFLQKGPLFMTVTSEVVDIYCRSAAEDGNTLAVQEAACRQFAKDAGLTIGMVYAEVASGRSLRREKLTLVRTRYKDDETQGVVVMTLDRLSRHAPDLSALQEEMTEHNVTLYCVRETVENLYQSISARVAEQQHS